MLKTVEGFYQDGQIQLSELPQEVNSHTQVLVTFLDADKIDSVKLRQLIDQLETIAGIQQGLEEVNAGQTRPIGSFIQEMQQKYDISG
jgi:cell division FtsZ-interacting protein ZapD